MREKKGVRKVVEVLTSLTQSATVSDSLRGENNDGRDDMQAIHSLVFPHTSALRETAILG